MHSLTFQSNHVYEEDELNNSAAVHAYCVSLAWWELLQLSARIPGVDKIVREEGSRRKCSNGSLIGLTVPEKEKFYFLFFPSSVGNLNDIAQGDGAAVNRIVHALPALATRKCTTAAMRWKY